MQILVCIFLAGILGSTHAQFQIPGLTRTSQRSGINVDEAMRKSCNDYGGPGAFDALIKSISDVGTCFSKVMNETTIEAAQKHPAPSKSMDTLLTVFCTKVSTPKNCARKFTDSMKTCSKPSTRADLDTVYKMMVRLVDFVCDNKEKFAEAANPSSETHTCFESETDSLLKCVQNIIPSKEAIVLHPDVPALAFSTNEEGCRNLESLEKCTVKALNGCKTKLSAELMDSLFKHINNEIPCANLEKSHASSASVVNVALLVAAIAITL